MLQINKCRIHANDGIDPSGLELFEKAGFIVTTHKVAQAELANFLRSDQVCALLVRSATKVTTTELSSWPGLRVIGRGGVGLDNIDLKTAQEKDIAVINTPAASSESVAELAFAHMFALSRWLQVTNREMPSKGQSEFEGLKKTASKGIELRGRTLGIVGFGRIGQALAALALGCGMKVKAHDPFVKSALVSIDIDGLHDLTVPVHTQTLDQVLAECDFVSLHVPKPSSGPLIGAKELAGMKKGAMIINTARGGVIDEQALIDALESGHLGGAGLDVFVGEPQPDARLLNNPCISVSPHIGASTAEAQNRIGIELAEKVMAALNQA